MSELTSKELVEALQLQSPHDTGDCIKVMQAAASEIERLQQRVTHMERVICDAEEQLEAAGRPEGELLAEGIKALRSAHEPRVATQAEAKEQIEAMLARGELPSVEIASNVTQLHTANSKLSRTSEAIAKLLDEMRRAGMETLRACFDGMSVRVDPEDTTQRPGGGFIEPALARFIQQIIEKYSALETIPCRVPGHTECVKSSSDCKVAGECTAVNRGTDHG